MKEAEARGTPVEKRKMTTNLGCPAVGTISFVAKETGFDVHIRFPMPSGHVHGDNELSRGWEENSESCGPSVARTAPIDTDLVKLKSSVVSATAAANLFTTVSAWEVVSP